MTLLAVFALAVWLTWTASGVAIQDGPILADVDGLGNHFSQLTSQRYRDGSAAMLAQSGSYHLQTLLNSQVLLPADSKLNSIAINVHLTSLTESIAQEKLTRLQIYFTVQRQIFNASQLEDLKNYILQQNILSTFLQRMANMDAGAQSSVMGPIAKNYRAIILGLNLVNSIAHNLVPNRHSTLGINHLSCLDPSELKFFKGLIFIPRNNTIQAPSVLLSERIKSKMDAWNLPESIDWTNSGAVGPVLNQGTCGSCWAFAAVQVLQSRLVISGKGKLTSLSEQELVSCIPGLSNGCLGSTYEQAWLQVQSAGIVGDQRYPYSNGGSKVASSCNTGDVSQAVVNTTVFQNQYYQAPISSELEMMMAVANGGPIAISIATPSCFSNYVSGVLTAAECACYDGSNIDHAVTIVGYGEENGVKYWKVKNSWGPGWGMAGYILLERQANTPEGMCGLRTDPNYPQSVQLSPACQQANPPSYCAQALQPLQYTNVNTTTGQPMNSCMPTYSGEYSDPNCTNPIVVPVWAWVLVGIGAAIVLLLLVFLTRFLCMKYAPAGAWYNVFGKSDAEGYRLLSKDEEAAGKAPVPNNDPRAFAGRSSASEQTADDTSALNPT